MTSGECETTSFAMIRMVFIDRRAPELEGSLPTPERAAQTRSVLSHPSDCRGLGRETPADHRAGAASGQGNALGKKQRRAHTLRETLGILCAAENRKPGPSATP